MDLDFSALSDDQLEALFREICIEATRRGVAVASALHEVGLDVTEQSRVAREAAEREVERIRKDEEQRVAQAAAAQVRTASVTATQAQSWGVKKWFAQRLDALYRDVAGYSDGMIRGTQLHVWRHASGETRVFVGAGFDKNHVTLFVTGRGRNAPGALEYGDRDFRKVADRLKPLLEMAASVWPAGAKVDLIQALRWQGEIVEPKAAQA